MGRNLTFKILNELRQLYIEFTDNAIIVKRLNHPYNLSDNQKHDSDYISAYQ